MFGVGGAGTAAGGGGAVLSASDPRVRRVPFMTQRPTLSEVKRAMRLPASVFEIPAEVIAEQQQRLDAEAAERAASEGALFEIGIIREMVP